LIAKAAASGAGATDTTVLNVAGDLQKQGTLAALTDLWNGQNRRTGAQNQTNATMYQAELDANNDLAKGEAAKRAGYLNAAGTILSGGGFLKGCNSKTINIDGKRVTVSGSDWNNLRASYQ
jgi:hypothetical protein